MGRYSQPSSRPRQERSRFPSEPQNIQHGIMNVEVRENVWRHKLSGHRDL
jgi:hypothetical protein